MPDETGRFEWVARMARVVFVGTAALLAIAIGATVVMAVLSLIGPPTTTNPILWVLLVVVELMVMMWAVVFYGTVRMMAANEFAASGASARIHRVETLLDDTTKSIRELADLAPLSDQAKSLLFRDRELEALREAIHEDMIKQDYQTAEKLVETIESRMGYHDEAVRLRQEIAQSRTATLDEKIDQAIARIDELCQQQKWAQALRESHRILRIFPKNIKVAALPDHIKKARNDRKKELLQGYGEAVRKNDVDRGVELLQELDVYLTPQEGAALQESARGVFKARLHNLGVQFAICVTDQRWHDAIEAGEAIIREFPNSRFAQEVREKMDNLRSRAVGKGDPARPAVE
jgi:tetratricopeptide (TPR) repeat protein